MPKKAKAKPEVDTTEVEATPVETKPEVELARGERSKAIKKALKAHKDKSPKEIAEIVTASGITTLAWQVSNVKSILANKKKVKATPAAPATEAAAPALPKDAISVALLQKAKKLVAQLGGIKEAKQAIDALAQLMD